MEAKGGARVLWAGDQSAAEALPGGPYRVDGVGSAREAVAAAEAAEVAGDPYAACFVEVEDGLGSAWVSDLLRMSPALFLVLEVSEEEAGGATELGSWARPDRCLVLTRPVRPLVRRSLAEHLGARWRAEQEGRQHLSLLEAEASRDRAAGRRSEQRLRMLYGIVEKLHGATRLDDSLRITLGEMSGFLGAKTGSLLLLEEGSRLRVLEAVGPQRERILGLEVPIEQSRISRYALEGGEPILVEDIQENDRFRESEEAIRFRARSILSIPLFSQGDALGVLNFGGEEKGTSFTAQDRDLVVTLGRHVAVALEKARLVEGLRQTVAESIRALAGAIEAKDPYTRGHSDRVTHYSRLIAQRMGMDARDLDVLVRAAILHDVGKIGVPEAVLHKPGRLDRDEFAFIQRHPEVGVEIVREILAMVETLPIIRHHHEHFNGKGYPHGVGGEEIPLGARILAVADTYDAMTSDRPYRKGLAPAVAFAEIERCSGAQFDPEVSRTFLDGAPTWSEVAPL